MESVVILDYGSGNLHSVAKALEYVADAEYRVTISDDNAEIMAAGRIVFPGQGAMGQCMQTLISKGFSGLLKECIRTKPFLGICMGLQTLMDFSEEDGGAKGLGVIPGKVLKFPTAAQTESGAVYKIPHMGWNNVRQITPHPLWKGIKSEERFYFVHSYYAQPDRRDDCAGITNYLIDFASAAARDNLFATQFHPEKSQRAGLTLLRNFLNWRP